METPKVVPTYLKGHVVKGFGRGSTSLGFPTANLDPKAFEGKINECHAGVYYGWAKVEGLSGYDRMVMSIGKNVTFDQEDITVEAHILRTFDKLFYGEVIHVIIEGYIRPMIKFSGLDELIQTINKDIEIANEKLSSINVEESIAKYTVQM